MRSITVSKSVDVDVDVEVDIDDIVESLDADELRELAARAGFDSGRLAFGKGDASRIRNIIDSAERAARSLSNLPREIADLFWHVHERAI